MKGVKSIPFTGMNFYWIARVNNIWLGRKFLLNLFGALCRYSYSICALLQNRFSINIYLQIIHGYYFYRRLKQYMPLKDMWGIRSFPKPPERTLMIILPWYDLTRQCQAFFCDHQRQLQPWWGEKARILGRCQGANGKKEQQLLISTEIECWANVENK